MDVSVRFHALNYPHKVPWATYLVRSIHREGVIEFRPLEVLFIGIGVLNPASIISVYHLISVSWITTRIYERST